MNQSISVLERVAQSSQTQERLATWRLAELAAEKNPGGIQGSLNNALWNADAIRNDLSEYMVEHLGEEDAVLVVGSR